MLFVEFLFRPNRIKHQNNRKVNVLPVDERVQENFFLMIGKKRSHW